MNTKMKSDRKRRVTWGETRARMLDEDASGRRARELICNDVEV